MFYTLLCCQTIFWPLAIYLNINFQIWPIDVAAEAGHLPCVKQILDQIIIKENPDYAKYPYVALACVPGSVASLHLIMKKDKPKEVDIKKAIELSLRSANAQCLDILLKEKVKTDSMFDKMNFFHMLYTYSGASAFTQHGGYKRLPDVTQVLVKHKHDVKARSPPNTYPLYSLIKNALCIHDYVNTRHYIMCMRILLEEGADPNFDEVVHEIKQNQKGVKTMHGRQAYSSAMHCLLETVEFFAEYLESKALGVRFITQMADVLLQNHGKINSIGRIGDKNSKMYGTVLHQFAKSSVKLGVDNDVFKFLLRQGADPNTKWDGRYVINTFFDTLFPSLKEINIHTKAPDYTDEVQRILALSLYMNRECVQETLMILLETWSKATNPQVKKYIKVAVPELEARIKEVWPLKRICRTLIWDLCSRNASNVHKLPTDIESRTYILPLV